MQGLADGKQAQIDQMGKDKGELNIKLTSAEQKAKEWEDKYKVLLTQGVAQDVTIYDAFVVLFKSFMGWAKNVKVTKQPAM
jgi:hypothetical protein